MLKDTPKKSKVKVLCSPHVHYTYVKSHKFIKITWGQKSFPETLGRLVFLFGITQCVTLNPESESHTLPTEIARCPGITFLKLQVGLRLLQNGVNGFC